MKLKRITITSIFINFALMLLILYAYRGKIENVLINRGGGMTMQAIHSIMPNYHNLKNCQEIMILFF